VLGKVTDDATMRYDQFHRVVPSGGKEADGNYVFRVISGDNVWNDLQLNRS
jgi:hypothetical protein